MTSCYFIFVDQLCRIPLVVLVKETIAKMGAACTPMGTPKASSIMPFNITTVEVAVLYKMFDCFPQGVS